MAIRIILFFLFSIFISVFIAQNSNEKLNYKSLQAETDIAYNNHQDTTHLIELHKKIIHQNPDYQTTKDSSIIELFAYIHNAKGIFYKEYKLEKQTLLHYDSAIYYHLKNKNTKVSDNYFNKAAYYAANFYYKEAIENFNQSLTFSPSDSNKTDIYVELVKIYKAIGDYDKSLKYSDLALFYAQNSHYNEAIRKIFVDKSVTFKAYEKEDSLFFYANKALSKMNHYSDKIEPAILFSANLNLGIYYESLKKYPEALTYYKIAQKSINLQLNENNHYNWLINNNLSVIYSELNQPKNAEIYLDSAFSIQKRIYANEKHPNTAITYQTKADKSVAKKDYIAALAAYQQGIIQTIPHFSAENYHINPDSKLFSTSNMKNILLEILIEKAKTLTIQKEEKFALNTYLCADTLIDVMRKEHHNEATKLFWRNKAQRIYKQAIELAYKLKEKEKLFYLMEKNKSVLLLDELKNNIAKQILPDSIREEELLLQNKIDILLNDKKKTKDLIEKQKEYEIFIKQIEKEYPIYYQLKYKNEVANIQALRDICIHSDKDIFVTYFVSDSSIYAYSIKKESENYHKIAKPPYFDSLVTAYTQLISSDTIAQNWARYQPQFNAISLELYKCLILPLQLPKQGNLIISPDNNLWQVSFEALYKDSYYLIEDYDIQYVYSASILLQNSKKNKEKGIQKWAVFAPIKFQNAPPLYETEKAIAYLKDKVEMQFFLKTEANTHNFNQKAGDYAYLWLATHASAGDSLQESNILLYDTNINLGSLYKSYFRAKTVILSACETNKGKIAKGEGMMSLARAFAYSGVPITISAQWQVDEVKTMDIMKRFFTKTDKNKSEVARISEIKRFYSKEDAPYYWAGIAVMGHYVAKQHNYVLKTVFLFLVTMLFIAISKYIMANFYTS